jgi:hypothetical protein
MPICRVQVIDNDGLHGMEKKSGKNKLAAGQHVSSSCCSSAVSLNVSASHRSAIFAYHVSQEIAVDFFQGKGGAGLILYWSGPGVSKLVPIPASAFRCNPEP